MTGPGAIMVGLAIGSGELVLWPWITAKFGAQMMWAAAVGVFLQMWLNIEIGRWAIATGESAFTGLARLSRFWVHFWLILLIGYAFLPGFGLAAGLALKMRLFGGDGPGPDWMWAAIVLVGALAILLSSERIYQSVERTVVFLVVVIVVGLIIVASSIGTAADVSAMVSGSLNFGHIALDDEFTFDRFFGAIAFAGAGGYGNLLYAYYLRDKGIGMGKRIPPLLNPLRQTQLGASEIGYVFQPDAENMRRFRDWFRFVLLDTSLCFWLLNTFTMFLFMFGALVVLFPRGIVPEQGQLLWDLATILESTMGAGGRTLFLVIGFAALFSSIFGGLDGGGRLWVDLLHTNFAFAQRIAANRLYLGFAVGLTVIGIFATWLFGTYDVGALDFFFIGAAITGFSMAGYVPMVLYLNLKYLPPAARPGPVNIFMMSIASLTYISFAIYTVWSKIAEWLA